MDKCRIYCVLVASMMFLVWGANIVRAEDAPKGNKGFTASKTTTVELANDIEGMAGRQLRMRVLTIEPGGYIGIHSHENRPAVVYFMQGTDEVGLADGSTTIKHPGDTAATPGSTTHYHRNVGKGGPDSGRYFPTRQEVIASWNAGAPQLAASFVIGRCQMRVAAFT